MILAFFEGVWCYLVGGLFANSVTQFSSVYQLDRLYIYYIDSGISISCFAACFWEFPYVSGNTVKLQGREVSSALLCINLLEGLRLLGC